MIWETSLNSGSTWTTMASPSSFRIDWEDLDSDSYRSVINGNLNRNIIKRRWSKIQLAWNFIDEATVNTILTQVNRDGVTFRFKSPAFGTNSKITFEGYVSKMSTECLEGQIGWNLSFNVVQSKVAQWQ